MTVYADIHARPGLGSRDEASGSGGPVADAAPTEAMMPMVGATAVRVLDSGGVGLTIGWRPAP